jgi:hypothetical protein
MMKLKPLATLTLLAACVVFIYLIFPDGDHQTISAEQSSQSSGKTSPVEEKATSQDATPAEYIVATYFHGNRRCKTCLTIEAYTEEALKEKFGDALKNGKLVWRSVDVSVSENQHFVNDYQLYAQSVILSAVQDGKQTKWKNLDKVWQIVRDKAAFFSYIQNETADFMKASK